MSQPEYFISCDWGTTNFRIRLVNANTLEVLREFNTDQGVRMVYQQFRQQSSLNQIDYFAAYLKEQIARFPKNYQSEVIVLSGMASSNIGLMELEYADLPFEGTGKSLTCRRTRLPNELEILMISGVKSQKGMMRGEEVQAIGLEPKLSSHGKGILILPGTHSKHIDYREGMFVNFRTFMTGELFEVISSHSILTNSVNSGPWNETAQQTFEAGLALGAEGKMSESLFEVRARQVLNQSAAEENYYFLSGLLIGDELSYLKHKQTRVFLAADRQLAAIYQLALSHLIGSDLLVTIGFSELEQALLAGQSKMLKNYG